MQCTIAHTLIVYYTIHQAKIVRIRSWWAKVHTVNTGFRWVGNIFTIGKVLSLMIAYFHISFVITILDVSVKQFHSVDVRQKAKNTFSAAFYQRQQSSWRLGVSGALISEIAAIIMIRQHLTTKTTHKAQVNISKANATWAFAGICLLEVALSYFASTLSSTRVNNSQSTDLS